MVYIVISLQIYVGGKKIDIIKTLLKPKLLQDLQVFIMLANFYTDFIYKGNKIVAFFFSMLKTNLTAKLTILRGNKVNWPTILVFNLIKFIKNIYNMDKSSFLTPDTR